MACMSSDDPTPPIAPRPPEGGGRSLRRHPASGVVARPRPGPAYQAYAVEHRGDQLDHSAPARGRSAPWPRRRPPRSPVSGDRRGPAAPRPATAAQDGGPGTAVALGGAAGAARRPVRRADASSGSGSRPRPRRPRAGLNGGPSRTASRAAERPRRRPERAAARAVDQPSRTRVAAFPRLRPSCPMPAPGSVPPRTAPSDGSPHRRRSADRARPRVAEAARGRDGARAGSRRPSPDAEVERRAAWCRRSTYPDELPVSRRRDDIAAAIRDHQVVIVAGETGSGKTTQLPKICLELGRGVHGMIGHTQPRRIAARSVAERIAEEIGRPLGETVGYQVRFTDHSSRDTLVKLMTDGILLAELQRDRMLLGLRHDHHRRGPRAQPQRRLPAGLPQAAAARAAPTSRSSSPRPPSTRTRFSAALRRRRTACPRRSSRCRGGPTRSRCATGRWSQRPEAAARRTRSTRRASSSSATRPRPSSRPSRELARARARATSWSSCRASARSATPPTCWRG